MPKNSSKKQKQPEFPGAPVWEDWFLEQRRVKTRQVGFMRRAGRMATKAAAVSILVAKETPRAATEYRHKKSAREADRLQRVANRAHSAEAIPNVDLRKVHKSKLRKLGVGAVSALNRSNERAQQRASHKATVLAERDRANRQVPMGRAEAWASNKMYEIDDKKRASLQRRYEQFETEKQAAWDKYLEKNPEVKQRLIAEQEQRARQNEIEQKQRDRRYETSSQMRRYGEMQSKASSATKYFAEKNSYSFSKALPHRSDFEGSYDELAKSSVERAARGRLKDGSVPLFNKELLFGIVQEKMPLSAASAKRDGPVVMDQETYRTTQAFHDNDRQLFHDIREKHDYVGGAATSLWKMGFVEFDSEDTFRTSSGHRMNEAIEWSKGEDGTTFASLAYNPDNELHRIVAGDQADPSSARIQLAIGGEHYAPEMSVSLVRQPALTA